MIAARPHRNAPEIVAKAIEGIMADVVRWTNGDPAAEVRRDLIRCADEDAYRFARALDERCGWYPDAELVEILSGYSTYAARSEAVKAWAAECGITIPFAVGDIITARGEQARIVSLRPEKAEIVAQPVKPDGHNYGADGGWIIPVEDAQAVGETA